MDNIDLVLLIVAFLMLLSAVSSKLSGKFGVPVLVIFLALGMLAGSDGLLGISFDDAILAQAVGTLALIFILFGGGLDTEYRVIKPVLTNGLILATFGVLITALVMSVFVYYLLDFTYLESLLLGSIISSTDAAAVFAILRAKGIKLKRGLAPLLEFESGSNDPMAIFLTVTVLQLILIPAAPSVWDWIVHFFLQFSIGISFGIAFGLVLPRILNKVRLDYYGLYPVITIAWVLLLFSLTNLLDGNGYLAIYIAGIVINTKDFVHKKNLVGFHDGLAWIMQIAVFITLGLLVFPSQLPEVALNGFLIALWLMFIARPISVFLGTLFSKRLSFREKTFVSWVGLRGAVPIVLATYPYVAGLENSALIFNTVFFVVLLSIFFQGTTLSYLSKLLKVDAVVFDRSKKEQRSTPLLFYTIRQFAIDKNSSAIGTSIAELELPKDFLILLIKRDKEYIRPVGSTIFKENDILLIQCDKSSKYKKILRKIFG